MESEDLFTLDQPDEWRAALRGTPHGYAHTWEYWHAMSLTTSAQAYLYCYASENGRFLCPFVEREFEETRDLLSTPGLAGFVGRGDFSEAMARWTALGTARNLVCAFVGLHPHLASPGSIDYPLVHTYSTAFGFDLTVPLEALLSRMSSSRRRDLTAASRLGVTPEVNTPGVHEFFRNRFEEVFELRASATEHYLSLASREALCQDPRVLMIGAGRGRVESVSVFGFTEYVGDGIYNVSMDPKSSFSTVIIWQAIVELQKRGVKYLNLGGGVRAGDGVAAYKRSLGAMELPLRCIRQVFDQDTFSMLCKKAGKTTDSMDGYFPPYRDPRLQTSLRSRL